MQELPFKCRTVGSAATADVEVTKPSTQKDGKYEVMFPVAFPDQGTFDWLDAFLQKNKRYVELSDRAIIDWAQKSGLFKPKATGLKNSNDRPEFNYGLTAMDDLSVRRVLQAVAPLVPRNYVVMEVKENLTTDDRKTALKRFNNPVYKKVARVVMGEPDQEFKDVVHSRILKEKKEKAEADAKAKKAEKERKKQLATRQKQLAEMRKKADEQRKKAEAEKKAKAEAAKREKLLEEIKKKNEAKAKKRDAGEDVSDDEPEPEEPVEEPVEETPVEEEAKEEENDDEEEEPEVEVELSEEDKQVWFRPAGVSDLSPAVLAASFGKFALPEEDEGFDDIKYEWQKRPEANKYLRNWVTERKITSRIEDLKPSAWFKEKVDAFAKAYKGWQDKAKPIAEKKKKDALKKKAEKKDGEEEEEEPKPEQDLFAIDNIDDAGNGEPLYVEFGFEDWALLSLRYEFFLLVQAYKNDVDDEERVGIHESNLVYYYNKYYAKQLTPKYYGKDSNQDLIEMVKDTVAMDKEHNVLISNLESDVDCLDIFVKLTEESRRERQRRCDAGDETARLKFNPLLNQLSKPKAAPVASSTPAAAAFAVRPTLPAGATAPKPGLIR